MASVAGQIDKAKKIAVYLNDTLDQERIEEIDVLDALASLGYHIAESETENVASEAYMQLVAVSAAAFDASGLRKHV